MPSIAMGPAGAITSVFLYLSSDLFRDSDAAGFSFDQRCPGAIPVNSFTYSVAQKGSEAAGRPRSVESVTHNDFSLTRFADNRTPKLFRFVARADYFSEANVLVFAEYPRQPNPYLIYHMTYVHVSSYSVALASRSALPIETLTLKYGQMKVIGRGAYLPFLTQKMPNPAAISESFSLVMNVPANIFSGTSKAGKAHGDDEP